MSYTCPVCKIKYKTSQDCGNCGFPTPPRLFLSESHAKNWFNVEVLPRRTAWETTDRISKLETLVKSHDAELQELKNQDSKLKALVKSHGDEIQKLKNQDSKLKALTKSHDGEIQKLRAEIENLKQRFDKLTVPSIPSDKAAIKISGKGSDPWDGVKVGDKREFGPYSWRVLDVQNNKALILSERIIEKRPYDSGNENATWETCELRRYLNGEFYNSFSTEEKARIAEMPIPNNNNSWYGTSGGNATNDKIFLLSIEEVVKYFGDSGDLKNRKGWYEENNNDVLKDGKGYYINDEYNSARKAVDADGTASWWRLRSPGGYSVSAAYVGPDGRFSIGGVVHANSGGLRPALWLNL